MTLLTRDHIHQLLLNGMQQQRHIHEADEGYDPLPVVKLFTPCGACTWLLTELDPDDHDLAFGLCDLGMGFPELGSVRMSELEGVRDTLGLTIESDRGWQPRGPISAYALAARAASRIVQISGNDSAEGGEGGGS